MAARKKSTKKNKKTKVVALHKTEDAVDEKQTLLQQAAAAKKNDDIKLAEQLYKKEIGQKAFNAAVYKKLMVLYRKQKRYKDELDIINKGLKHFEDYSARLVSQKKVSAGIKKLSSSLNKSMGLTNSKGKALYEPEPVGEWKKRKTTVTKKLKQS